MALPAAFIVAHYKEAVEGWEGGVLQVPSSALLLLAFLISLPHAQPLSSSSVMCFAFHHSHIDICSVFASKMHFTA